MLWTYRIFHENKTLDQVMTELDNEFEVETSDRYFYEWQDKLKGVGE